MRTHTIKVRGRRASIDDRMLVQGTVGEDVLALDLDEEWDGFVVTVAFKWQHDSSIVAKQVEGGYEVPWECNQHPGKVLVAIEGTLGGKVMRHATIDQPMVVLSSEDAGGAAPSDPTVGEFRQAYEDAKTATESAAEAAGIAKAAASAASSQAETAKQSAASADAAADAAREAAVDVKRRADSGEFKGEKGDPGPKLTFADLTEADKAELQKPATDAAATANAAAKAANDAADAANTAAEAAVSDAQAAIAEVKATEAKLYPAAENILVGSETGAVAHADDAFSGASLRGITVEGACEQDGTPSPDSPVPIEVIENPTVKMCGRTLCSIDELHSFYYNIINYNNTRALDKYVGLQVTVSLDFTSSIDLGGDVRVYGYQNYGIGFDTVKSTISYKSVKAGQTYHYRYTDKLAKLGQSFSNFGSIIVYPMEQADRDKRPKIIVTNFRIECGGTETPYEPYTEQSATFTLPSEHPYLAKLPNGTADEITVDEEGNVELVARVERVLPSDYRQLDFGDGGDGSAYVSLRKSHASISVNSLMCSSYTPSNPTIKSGFIYTPNYTNIVIRDDRFTSKDKAIELLDGVVVYTAVEPTRYSLGRIDMPKAQDSIVNVWTDAEVTPNTGIEYVRDVNIVVANIEKAIASITEG